MQEDKQQSKKEQSNRLRTEVTRAALISAARTLFAEKGFVDTGTPEIVSAAGVTRGALYHHFIDKLGLFRVVVEREAEAVMERIAVESAAPESALDGILTGADAYFDAMCEAGRARLLLIDGPAVLGVQAMSDLDRRTGQRELRQGLEAAIQTTDVKVPLDALTSIFSAAFDKAALAIVLGESSQDFKEAIRILAEGIPGMKSDG